jgi:outer membrane protein OmpA-like peptidoglycan-associated protein
VSRPTLFVVLLACGLGACALLGGRDEPSASPPPTAAVARGELRLAQLEFGRQAHFAECTQPGCPSRTPKTIAPTLVRQASQPAAASNTPVAPTETVPTVASVAALLVERASPQPDRGSDQRLTLLFALGNSALTGEHKARLRDALPRLRRSERIVVAGRTDDLGSEALNQSLALARGLAVRDYLLDIDPQLPARIAIDARGRCCYVAPNDNERSRSRNRRVEIAYSSPSSGASRPGP